MRADVIISVGIGLFIALMLTALSDRFIRESNKHSSFLNRKFRLTGLEIILFALYLFISFSVGVFLIILGITFFDNYFIKPAAILLGLGYCCDFTLLLNHIIYECFQSVNLDAKKKILHVRRFGKDMTIHLDAPNTFVTIYKPPYDKKAGNKDWKLLGARFPLMEIKTSHYKIKLSGQIRIKFVTIYSRVPESNRNIKSRQINFIY